MSLTAAHKSLAAAQMCLDFKESLREINLQLPVKSLRFVAEFDASVSTFDRAG
jgi:hypothetical protein